MAVQSWAWWAGVGRSLAACGVTSLGCARWQRGPFHHDSRAATRKASSSPAARMQKTPAKLCSLRARPSGWGSACLSRSQRPFRGHHFCFIMSRSPFSCRSRILKLKGKWIVKRAELLICHCFLSNNKNKLYILKLWSLPVAPLCWNSITRGKFRTKYDSQVMRQI